MATTVAQLLTVARELPPREREALCIQIEELLDAPLTAGRTGMG